MSKFFLKSFNFIFYIAFVYSSGFIVKYAFAPYNIWPLAIVSPVALLYIWDKYDHRKLLSSFVYGLGYFTAGSWVFYSFSEHSDISFTISIIVTLIIVAALSLGFIIVHVLTNKIKSPESFRILCLFPASWVLMEYFRTISELSYPWLFISYSQTSSPIIYTSVFIGTYGTSFLIILFAGSIYLFLKKRKPSIAVILLFLISFVCYNYIFHEKTKHSTNISTLLIQNNTSEQDKWDRNKLKNLITTYEKIILENLHPHSLVILPETAIPLVPESAQQAFENIDITLKRNDATAIIGTLSKSGNDTFNSAVSIGKDYSVTRKNRLVAFGESTPNIPFVKSIGSNFGFPMSDLKENKVANKPLNFNNNKVAIFICFEIGFPNEVSERASDADILVVMSDNIWFGNSNASYQHRQISQFYAIMYAKPVLFVNNSGLSSVISANGEILQEIPDHKKAIIDYNLKF